mgnify:CR=1 FL=1|tara:strand:- start:989 stop:1183 length:195 start_codon:yes stop_codon:yes gene_type:complete
MSGSKMTSEENNDNLPLIKSPINNQNKRKRKNSYSKILKGIKESSTEKPLSELIKYVPSKIDKI